MACKRQCGGVLTESEIKLLCAAIGPDNVRKAIPPPPILLPANRLPWRLYGFLSTQPIMAPMGGVIYFSIPALVSLMDIYRVKDRKECFEKIALIWQLMHSDPDKGEPGGQRVV